MWWRGIYELQNKIMEIQKERMDLKNNCNFRYANEY